MNGNIMLSSDLFYRASRQFHAPASRSIWLRKYQYNFVPSGNKRTKSLRSKFRRTGKRNAHNINFKELEKKPNVVLHTKNEHWHA
jgi:hypothetical protein